MTRTSTRPPPSTSSSSPRQELATLARHYFDCGGVILAILDPTQGGLKPTPGAKSLYFAVEDIEEVHARAKALGALSSFSVHGQPASDVL